MTTTLPDTDVLAALEFRAEIPCEAKQHGQYTCTGRAVWVQVNHCDCPSIRLLVCESKRQYMLAPTRGGGGWYCSRCEAVDPKMEYIPIPEAC